MARWMRRGGRWQGAILMLALAALLAGCALPPLPWQSHSPAPLPDAQQVLRLSLPGTGLPVVNLDPTRVMSGASAQQLLMPLLYSTLVTFDAELRPTPSLAASYSVSADGLRYTFHLRSGARFADGAPLTSSDVAFSLNRAAVVCGSAFATFLDTLKDAALAQEQECQSVWPPVSQSHINTLIGDALLTPDPHTLVIVLAQSDGALLAKLAEPEAGIVEPAVVRRFGDKWTRYLADGGGQGTSGMYRLANTGIYDGVGGLALTLERASHYWGAAPRLREVVFDLRTQHQQAAGDVIFDDVLAYSVPHTSDFTWHAAPTRNEGLLMLDPEAPGLGDIRVRQALALAIDKVALAKSIGAMPTNHLTPPGIGGYPTALSGPIASAPLTGDVTRARALLQSYSLDHCGWATISCPRIYITSINWGILSALLARWQAVLPMLPIEAVDPPYFPGFQPTSYHIALPEVWYEDYPDPQDWVAFFSDESLQYFLPFIHDPNADALVMSAEDTRDPTVRLALYHEAEETVINDAVVVPIAQLRMTWGVKPTVVNFPTTLATTIAPTDWARIYLTTAR